MQIDFISNNRIIHINKDIVCEKPVLADNRLPAEFLYDNPEADIFPEGFFTLQNKQAITLLKPATKQQ